MTREQAYKSAVSEVLRTLADNLPEFQETLDQVYRDEHETMVWWDLEGKLVDTLKEWL